MTDKDTNSVAVTPVELFFDLIFVFAVFQLSHHLAEHFSLRGAFETAVLLVSVLTVWAHTSWAATMVPPTQISSKLMVLAIMVPGVLMNASISDAFGGAALSFVIPLLTIQLGRTIWIIVSSADARYREHFIRMLIWLIAATPLWVVGALDDPHNRLLWWLGAAVMELIGSWFAHPVPGRRLQSEHLPFDAEHMLERCVLFILIVLGETVLMIGFSLSEHPTDVLTILTAGLALLITISLWALSFGTAYRDLEQHLIVTTDPVKVSHRAINTVMLMAAGLIALAVANEKFIHHPVEHAKLSVGLMLSAGPATFLFAQAIYFRSVLQRSSIHHWVAGGVIAPLGLLTIFWPPYAVMSAVSFTMVAVALFDGYLTYRSQP